MEQRACCLQASMSPFPLFDEGVPSCVSRNSSDNQRYEPCFLETKEIAESTTSIPRSTEALSLPGLK